MKNLGEEFLKVEDILKTEPELREFYKKFGFVSSVAFDWIEETLLKIIDKRIENKKKSRGNKTNETY